jgi:protein TonB
MLLIGVNLFSCKVNNTQTLVGDTATLSPAEISSQTPVPDSGSYVADTYKASPNAIVTPVEGLPEFPGGYQRFRSFINKNLDQSKSAEAGRANITFVVEKDGSLSDVRAIGHIFNQPAIDEAVRVVKLSPKWIPGKQNGKPVRVQYTVPIVFN